MRPAWYPHWISLGIASYVPLVHFPFEPEPPQRRGDVYIFDRRYPFDAALVDTVLDALKDNTNVLLYGPPGTGKTTFGVKLCKYLAPLTYAKRLEANLIPPRFGVNRFAKLLRDYHCVVIDDARALLLKIVEHTSQAIMLLDVQTQLLDFLESAYDNNTIVIITTNVAPHLMDSAVLSRVKAIHVSQPPQYVREALRELGYKIVNEAGRSYRELLRGTFNEVVEIQPVQVKVRWQLEWLISRVAVYRPTYGAYTLPVEISIKIAAALSAITHRKAIYVRTPGGLDQLSYYNRPLVVMPAFYSLHELRKIAATYNATILTDEPTAEPLQVDVILQALCPEARFSVYECFKKAVSEAYGVSFEAVSI
ncbi:MAG: ATP-binding protein [Thermosphaera sp.]